MRDALIIPFPDEAVEGTLGARFDAIATTHPDRLAVEGERHRFTYAELLERSTEIAGAIQNLVPAGLQSRVVLLFDHDAPVVAAMLAVLKAGQVVVICDPDDPPVRTRLVVQDADPALILTSDAHMERASGLGIDSGRVLNIDRVGAGSCGNALDVSASAPAIILYTSGTTGRPKGVVRSHRAALHSAQNTIQIFGIGPTDRLTHLARVHLGQGQTPVWASLLSGASLHMFDLKAEGVDRLASWIDDRRITVYQSSVIVLRALSRTMASGRRLESVRVVRVGGEPMVADDQRIHTAHFNPASLFMNAFALTEVSSVAMQPVDAALAKLGGRVPIGLPVPGIEVAILDEHGQEVADGEEGEMVVTGRYLASGYWRDDALTRQRFTWRPDGACVFRTGDRARRSATGALEFAGRADLRVRVRGYRVELEEVQACLASHPAVLDAVALTERDEVGLSRLVAYFTTRDVDVPAARDLRRFVLDRLPDQMAPTVYVHVPSIPLTANGKVDRTALAASSRVRAPGTLVPPRTPTEGRLLEMWRATLPSTAIGVEDDFFVIGGDSLRAAQVLARAREAFHTDIHFRTFLRHSTIAELAALIDNGPRVVDGARGDSDAIRRRDPAAAVPLSFPQQQLWLIDRLTPDVVAYNNGRAVRLAGRLDVDALRQALDALVARHSSLRTTFEAGPDGPVQKVLVDVRPLFAVTDLGALPAGERDAAMTREIAHEIERPFDLRRDVLLRARLIRSRDDEHALVVVTHHIATDARSSEILFQDLATLYAASASGTPSNLPTLPIEYADFAVWQRTRTTDAVIQTDLAYWLARLADAPPSIDLPFDRRPRPDERPRAGHLRDAWPDPLVGRLGLLAREQGGTLFMVVMAAFGVLLSRYTGQHDLLVGSPMSGRRRAEAEPLVGFFANTAVFRVSTAGNPTFRTLVDRVRDLALEAYDHQALPFERLVEVLNPARRIGLAPLIDVVIGVRHGVGTGLTLPGLAVEPIDVEGGEAKCALAVTYARTPEGFDGQWTYDATRFDEATMARMVDHFRRLAEQLVDWPDERIGAIGLLSDDARRRAHVEWNALASVAAPEERLDALFARQVQASPDAIAIQAGDGTLTYRELDARATALAGELRRVGVQPGTPVGVLCDRSIAFVVGAVASLKNGSAYVPLDPEHPRPRITQMIESAGVGGVITADGVDLAWAAAVPRILSQDVAYVMFTSGSTGAPKAVAVTHAGVARLVVNANHVTFTCGDAVSHVAQTTFDGSTFEIWGALLNGARLVIVPRLVTLDARRFAAELEQQAVSVAFVPSALFNQFGHVAPRTFRALRQLLVGGDVLDPIAASRVLTASPHLRLVNVYGPTETTVFAMSHDVTLASIDGSPIPIGRPISSAHVLILDDERRIVPVGVSGEICIGGAGLAVGYVGDADLTAERFVPHPVVSGARLYRTGDIGAWNADGVIQFIGRRDEQVKIRGHRVEPAEVEAVVREFPGVRQAVVVPHGGVADRSLGAYVVPVHRHAVSLDALRAFITARVPDYMVPTALVLIDDVPLTANGKVDRSALPRPEPLVATRVWAAPREGIEMRVATVWRDALRVDRIGRDDHFFELGGHSLTAVQVTSRLDTALGMAVPARWIFEAPTLAAFAARIAEAADASVRPGRPRVSVRPAEYAIRAPAAAVQVFAWARREQPGDLGRMVVRAFDVNAVGDADALSFALTEIVRRHEVLRTKLFEEGDAVIQEVVPPYPVPVARHDLRTHRDAHGEADRLFQAEAHVPFTFVEPPWVRASVVVLPHGRSRVMLALPHVVYDGWSLDVLYREIETLYDAHVRGVTPVLRQPALQFADCVCADAGVVDARDTADIRFWQGALARLTDLRLPIKRTTVARRLLRHATRLRSVPGARRSATTGVIARAGVLAREAMTRRAHETPVEYGRIPIAIDAASIASLRAVAASAGTTLFTALLTACQAVLAKMAASGDIAVATFTTNRDRPELEGVVGNLGNTIIIRSRMSMSETFSETVRRVSADVIAAREHSHVWFETMSAALTGPGRMPIEYRVPVAFQLIQGLRRGPRFDGATAVSERTLGAHRSQRIAITLHEEAGRVTGSCAFDPLLFDADGCDATVRAFVATVDAAAQRPEQRLSDLVT